MGHRCRQRARRLDPSGWDVDATLPPANSHATSLQSGDTVTISDVRLLTSFFAAVRGNVTLRVAAGPRQYIADQVLAKGDVSRAMHERVQLCQAPQTEFALQRESLGVSRINHILTVHGHIVLEEREAAKIFDEVGQRSLERLFPGSITGQLGRDKPHSAPANQVLGTKEHAMLRTLQTSELSHCPSRGFWTRFEVQPQLDSCWSSLCWRD